MKFAKIQKPFVSPFVAIAFGILSVTGVLLFFHVKSGITVTLHEWFGWAFVISGCIHLVVNIRQLLAYLRLRAGIASVVMAICLALALGFAGVNRKGGPHKQDGEQQSSTQGGSAGEARQTASDARNP